MAAYPVPITTENHKLAWKYMARKQRWAMKKDMIRRISVTLAQLIFGCVAMILVFGVLYDMEGSGIRFFLDQVPEAAKWIRQTTASVLDGAPEGKAWIFRCLGVLYIVPLFVALLSAVPILLLYHPILPGRTGDPRQDAWRLWSMAKRAREYATRRDNNTAILFAVLIGMFFILFSFEAMSSAGKSNAWVLLYGGGFILGYLVINLPLHLLLKALYTCRIPKTMVTDAENYYTQWSHAEKPAEEAKMEA